MQGLLHVGVFCGILLSMPRKREGDFFFKVLFFLFIFLCGVFAGVTVENIRSVVYPPEVDFSLMWEVYDKMEEDFIYFHETEKEDIVYGAIKGMVESFEDPNTVFFDPESSKDLLDSLEGKFEGVGMEVGMRDEEIRIISPLPDTPAKKAGVQSGDVIISVDEESTKNMSLEEVVSRIRGPKGDPVDLLLSRKGEEIEFTIVRDVIDIPSMSWEMIGDDIAHIEFYQFHEGAVEKFSKEVNSILESSAKGLIVDVRGNPGGSLEVVKNIAGWFLEKDSVVALDYDGERKYKPTGTPAFTEYPLVVLSNEGSASASEIMIAALRDNRGTTIVGETSFGKGSIQSLNPMKRGSYLKLTTSEFLTPSGDRINDVGIEPDVVVEMDIEEEEDIQLEKAIELLKEKINN